MRLVLLTMVVGVFVAHGLSAGATTPGCAKTAPTLTAGASKPELVPPGATAVVVCHYRGLNPAATAHRLLRGKRVTSAAVVKRLSSEFDSLPKQRGRIACPMDDGEEIVATFTYLHSAPVAVSIGLSGCRTVSNGHLSRTAASTAGLRLIAQLISLLR